MRWTDRGIVLKIGKFSEKASILSILTQHHGLHSGWYRRRDLMLGDSVQAVWTARTEEQLGVWGLEVEESFAIFFMRDYHKLLAFQFVCQLLRAFLFERDPCPDLFKSLKNFLQELKGKEIEGQNQVFPVKDYREKKGIQKSEEERSSVSVQKQMLGKRKWIKSLIFFELSLLQKLGVVLDFSDIEKANEQDPLEYVSPKTGKVVTRSIGMPYKEKLLRLPSFLIQDNGGVPGLEDLTLAFKLLHHFFFSPVFLSQEEVSLKEQHQNLFLNLLQ